MFYLDKFLVVASQFADFVEEFRFTGVHKGKVIFHFETSILVQFEDGSRVAIEREE